MRPLIGIPGGRHYVSHERSGVYVPDGYTSAILQSGGLPVVLPPYDDGRALEYVERLDGLLLAGGGDIDPHYFGEEPVPGLGEIDPERDEMELRMLAEAVEAHIPILAICRGVQVLNVGFGGTLYQDLNTQTEDVLKHSQKAPVWHPTHSVRIESGTKLAEIFAPGQLTVNSFHHQAIRHVGSGLIVSAHATDGVIEAVESPAHPFIVGVQWHPELMWQRDPIFLRLFQAFVQVAVELADQSPN